MTSGEIYQKFWSVDQNFWSVDQDFWSENRNLRDLPSPVKVQPCASAANVDFIGKRRLQA